jgi:hypothetical protein
MDVTEKRPPKPTAPRVLLFSTNIRNSLDLARELNKPRLHIVVSNTIASRDALVPAQHLLRDAYPGLDLSSCLILEQGRVPMSPMAVYGLGGIGGACLIIGLAAMLFSWLCRSKGPQQIPVSV